MKVVVIIPAYNPDNNKLENLIVMLSEVKVIDMIIVVDDGSIYPITNFSFNKCVVLKNEKNKGKGFAMQKGIKFAKPFNFDIFIFLDADLVVERGILEQFIENINLLSNFDVVIGYPKLVQKKGFGIVKKTAQVILYLYTKKNIKHLLSGQRILKKDVVDVINFNIKGYGVELSTTIDIIKKNFKIAEVEFDFMHNEKGKSIKDLLHKAKQLRDILYVMFVKGRG